MQTTIRKFGNSKGAIIPARLLKSVGLDVNDKLHISVEDGRIIIEPLVKKNYSLNALLDDCRAVDMSLTDDEKVWLRSDGVGNEVV